MVKLAYSLLGQCFSMIQEPAVSTETERLKVRIDLAKRSDVAHSR